MKANEIISIYEKYIDNKKLCNECYMLEEQSEALLNKKTGKIHTFICIIVGVFCLLAYFFYYHSDSSICYITDTGSKYHFSSCDYLYDSKVPISVETAIDFGYELCGNCACSLWFTAIFIGGLVFGLLWLFSWPIFHIEKAKKKYDMDIFNLQKQYIMELSYIKDLDYDAIYELYYYEDATINYKKRKKSNTYDYIVKIKEEFDLLYVEVQKQEEQFLMESQMREKKRKLKEQRKNINIKATVILVVLLPITLVFFALSIIIHLVMYFVFNYVILPFRVAIAYGGLKSMFYFIFVIFISSVMLIMELFFIVFVFPVAFISQLFEDANYFESIIWAFKALYVHCSERFRDMMESYLEKNKN